MIDISSNIDNKFFKIWTICTHNYQEPKPLDNSLYNIYVTNTVKKRDNINILNPILSEYVCMYYVWKNQIRSDLIGFCHYRRVIRLGDIDFLKIIQENYFQLFTKFLMVNIKLWIIDILKCPWFIYSDMIEFLKSMNVYDEEVISSNNYFVSNEIYITTWDMFNQLMEFLNSYITFIKNKHNIDSIQGFIDHVKYDIIMHYKTNVEYFDELLYNNQETYNTIYDEDFGFGKNNCWRIYSYCIEILINYYICHVYKKYILNAKENLDPHIKRLRELASI